MTKILIIGGSKDQEILWIIQLCKLDEQFKIFTLFVDKHINNINWNIKKKINY